VLVRKSAVAADRGARCALEARARRANDLQHSRGARVRR
jgi:hypothetical protein